MDSLSKYWYPRLHYLIISREVHHNYIEVKQKVVKRNDNEKMGIIHVNANTYMDITGV